MLFDEVGPHENSSSQGQVCLAMVSELKFVQTEGLCVNRSCSHTCATFLGTGQSFIFILTMALFPSSR